MSQKIDYIELGVEKGFIQLNEDETKVTYLNLKNGNKTYKLSDPEEKVRASFYVELLYTYEYEAKNIGLEVEMPKRVPNHFADLVIYEPGKKDPYFVIEFKRPDISDNEFEQAVKQGIGNGRVLNAKYYGTMAGNTVRYFEEKKDHDIEDAFYSFPVNYGNPEEWKYTKGGTVDLEPIEMDALQTALDKAHKTIWAGGKRNPAEAFGEVAKVIFIKVWDEKQPRKTGEPYEFQRKRNESTSKLKNRINAMYDIAKQRDKQVFSKDIELNERELASVVEHLQNLNFNKTDLDIKGEAFQKFLGNFFKGDFGQYFTPNTATKFCIDMLGDELQNHHKVIDTSCGSGGFLLKALDNIREQATNHFPNYETDVDEYRQWYTHWHDFAEKKLFGIELNDAIARVAKMNMILHDDGHTNVITHDGLDDIKNMQKTNPEFKVGDFDFIFTNPPFGATVKKSEFGEDYLEKFELGKVGSKIRPAQKTEILFIERCFDFLKPGGQMAIVLPDGILTNSSLSYVRDYIKEKFKIRAVVSLSGDAFKAYGAGVKSSILFLQKWEGMPNADYDIFMAIAEKIGIDATGRKCENELDNIVEQFKNFNKNSSNF